MSRLIKFRIWDKQATNDSVTRKRPKMLQPDEVDSHVIWSLNEEPNTHEPQTRYEVMQFTGLVDENGVEIYEGDVVRIRDDWSDATTHQVKWGGDYPAFDLYPGFDLESNNLMSALAGEGGMTVEVIGNIYQNANLLVTES